MLLLVLISMLKQTTYERRERLPISVFVGDLQDPLVAGGHGGVDGEQRQGDPQRLGIHYRGVQWERGAVDGGSII